MIEFSKDYRDFDQNYFNFRINHVNELLQYACIDLQFHVKLGDNTGLGRVVNQKNKVVFVGRFDEVNAFLDGYENAFGMMREREKNGRKAK